MSCFNHLHWWSAYLLCGNMKCIVVAIKFPTKTTVIAVWLYKSLNVGGSVMEFTQFASETERKLVFNLQNIRSSQVKLYLYNPK